MSLYGNRAMKPVTIVLRRRKGAQEKIERVDGDTLHECVEASQ
jgi:hypothetical protein